MTENKKQTKFCRYSLDELIGIHQIDIREKEMEWNPTNFMCEEIEWVYCHRHWTFVNWSRHEFSISKLKAGARDSYCGVLLIFFIFVLLRSPFCLLILLLLSSLSEYHNFFSFSLLLIFFFFTSFFIRIFKLWRHQYTNCATSNIIAYML